MPNHAIPSVKGTLPPHAPCRLQQRQGMTHEQAVNFASTRPVQIATHAVRIWGCAVALPPHAPCRLQPDVLCERRPTWSLPPHAPCRLQRYTLPRQNWAVPLCLHTPRADCNTRSAPRISPHCRFASTRPVQIATAYDAALAERQTLCLHTPRADCNVLRGERFSAIDLCLHTPRADCNLILLAQKVASQLCLHTPRADCNGFIASHKPTSLLCLHTPRADCNLIFPEQTITDALFASTRPVQIATGFAIITVVG